MERKEMSMSEPTESVPPPKINELGQVVGFPLPDWKPPRCHLTA